MKLDTKSKSKVVQCCINFPPNIPRSFHGTVSKGPPQRMYHSKIAFRIAVLGLTWRLHTRTVVIVTSMDMGQLAKHATQKITCPS